MMNLNRFISENLIKDNEECLINEMKLDDYNSDKIQHTGIKQVDKKIDFVNSVLPAQSILQKLISLIKEFKSINKDIENTILTDLLPRSIKIWINELSRFNFDIEEILSNLTGDIKVFKTSFEFFKQIQTMTTPTIKYFVNDLKYLENTYIGKLTRDSDRDKYGTHSMMLSWEFDNDEIDIDKLISEMKKIKIKSDVKIDLNAKKTSKSNIIDVIFYR